MRFPLGAVQHITRPHDSGPGLPQPATEMCATCATSGILECVYGAHLVSYDPNAHMTEYLQEKHPSHLAAHQLPSPSLISEHLMKVAMT
jgi:hypothetical protein